MAGDGRLGDAEALARLADGGGPPLSRSTISRRIGWASGVKASLAIANYIVSVGGNRRRSPMPGHAVGTRDQWLSARRELLDAEKAHMRQGDELARRRQELPWVTVEKGYIFETDEGMKTLADSSTVAHSCSSITSCSASGSASTSRIPAAPAARSSLTTSTASLPTSRSRRDPGQRVDRPAGEAAGVRGTDGQEVPLGLIPRQRLQVRVRGGVHRGAAEEWSRLQLQARRPGGAAARGDERVRPAGRSGPSHIFDLRARRRAADGDLRVPGRGAVRPQRGSQQPGAWWHRHDEYETREEEARQ